MARGWPVVAFMMAGAVWLGGCSLASQQGRLTVYVTGGSRVEDGVPAAEVADGWALRFERVLVTVARVQADGTSGGMVAGDTRARIVNLTDKGRQVLLESTVQAGNWPFLRFSLVPADDASTALNASAADVQRMQGDRLTAYVEGWLSKADIQKRFAVGFTGTAEYGPCRMDATVQSGSAGSALITLHAEHLLRDSLIAAQPKLRGDALVSAESPLDQDDLITAAELKAVEGDTLRALPNLEQDPAARVTSLHGFVEQLVLKMARLGAGSPCASVVRQDLPAADGGR